MNDPHHNAFSGVVPQCASRFLLSRFILLPLLLSLVGLPQKKTILKRKITLLLFWTSYHWE